MKTKKICRIVSDIQAGTREKAPRMNPTSAMVIKKGVTGADLGNKSVQ